MKTVFLFFVVIVVHLFFLPFTLIYDVLRQICKSLKQWMKSIVDSIRYYVFNEEVIR